MNRTEFLKQTIFKNLEIIETMNLKYKDKHEFELSLCNYDSKDDLDEFVELDLKKNSTKNFVYTKVNNKVFFNVNHAKNIAHRHSNGDILINLDADNFLTEEFVILIVELFEKNTDVITRGLFNESVEKSGSYGRIAMTRTNFYKVGGYNEKFENCSFGDEDLCIRATRYLNLQIRYLHSDLLECIHHSTELRTSNYRIKNRMESLNINVACSDFYMENEIMNTNEYNKIEFGSI